MPIPAALADQACCVSITGKTITIECDSLTDAEELFKFLTSDIFGGHDEDE